VSPSRALSFAVSEGRQVDSPGSRLRLELSLFASGGRFTDVGGGLVTVGAAAVVVVVGAAVVVVAGDGAGGGGVAAVGWLVVDVADAVTTMSTVAWAQAVRSETAHTRYTIWSSPSSTLSAV
jgi:hypothetical protein